MSEESSVPTCVGIILDGNRRWARANNLSTFEGHQRGMDNVEPITLAARDLGIKHLVVYAFSTENWNRSKEEVAYLLQIFEDMAKSELARLTKEGVRIRFVGQRDRFSDSLREAMQNAEDQSAVDPRITLWICLSYGGRADIVQSAQTLAKKGEEITEESLASHLWTSPEGVERMPDPDLIIRTSGEHRLSNFLLWQAAYSELFFPTKHWPEFTKQDLEEILQEYAERERRHGK